MGSVSERYCARGEQCRLYNPKTGRPQRLSRYYKSDVHICDQCAQADSDADFEAHQRLTTVEYEPVKDEKNPLRARLVLTKRNLVAQMLARRGGYWNAICDVRARWGLDPVPTRLPPESGDILYPTTIPAQRPPRPMELILPPDRPNEHQGEPGNPERYEAWLNERSRWVSDLGDVLRACLPEKYLGEETPPYVDWPPAKERWLPWYRFAAACVLYHPPLEKAPVFADYGGLPLSERQEAENEPMPNVLTERTLRQGAIDERVQHKMDNWISEKAWELREELGGMDFREARREVVRRFPEDIEAEENRLTAELYEREIERDPPYRYYPEFDPAETTNKEMLNTLPAIRANEGLAQKPGRKQQDDLLPVMCARLLAQPGWSPELLADQLGRSAQRVRELAEEGRTFS